jgi:hypothetical protein
MVCSLSCQTTHFDEPPLKANFVGFVAQEKVLEKVASRMTRMTKTRKSRGARAVQSSTFDLAGTHFCFEKCDPNMDPAKYSSFESVGLLVLD